LLIAYCLLLIIHFILFSRLARLRRSGAEPHSDGWFQAAIL
jgi:hypothetical protein